LKCGGPELLPGCEQSLKKRNKKDDAKKENEICRETDRRISSMMVRPIFPAPGCVPLDHSKDEAAFDDAEMQPRVETVESI
jgi:hypothetical protein